MVRSGLVTCSICDQSKTGMGVQVGERGMYGMGEISHLHLAGIRINVIVVGLPHFENLIDQIVMYVLKLYCS